MLSNLLKTVLIAAVATAGAVSPAFAQSGKSDSDSVHTNGGRAGAVDAYTDGAKVGKAKPNSYTDGARSGKFDPYTDGAKQSTKSNLRPGGSAAKVGDSRSEYMDGAKSGKADPYTDGAKRENVDPYTDGAKKP